jgi:hypothetical protein
VKRLTASVLGALALGTVGTAAADRSTPPLYASYSSGSPTFLNVGVDYPSSRRFVVVIWGTNRGRFGAPENRYRSRMICVHGTITNYGGVAQITATSPTQIFIARS